MDFIKITDNVRGSVKSAGSGNKQMDGGDDSQINLNERGSYGELD